MVKATLEVVIPTPALSKDIVVGVEPQNTLTMELILNSAICVVAVVIVVEAVPPGTKEPFANKLIVALPAAGAVNVVSKLIK